MIIFHFRQRVLLNVLLLRYVAAITPAALRFVVAS